MNLDFILNKRLDKPFLVQTFQEQPVVFKQALQNALTHQQPHAWRATWIIASCTKKNDERILPFVDKLIACIPDKKDGHQRELLKILSKITLDETQEGKLFDYCMTIWENTSKAPAVRYVSFKYIFSLYQKYPELENEIAFICQKKYLETLSPGIQKIIYKMITPINKTT